VEKLYILKESLRGLETSSNEQTKASSRCPKCGSKKVWKDGHRYPDRFSIQKYVCANPKCLHHFVNETDAKNYKPIRTISKRHVSDLTETKNMAPEREIKTRPGENQPDTEQSHFDQFDIKGKLVDFNWYMTKQNFSPETIRTNDGSLRALAIRNANLMDPESVKEVLANGRIINKNGTLGKAWSPNRKRNIINVYTLFLKINSMTWALRNAMLCEKSPISHQKMER
jgi:transposase-like protein